MIGQTIGHYRILEEIGRGGMGVVYRARDENLRRDVALKLLPAGMLADLVSRLRTSREVVALSRLNHPAVAVIHDRISRPESDCIVMEFVAGESLDQKLSRGRLPEPEAIRLGIQLAQGMAAAHGAGILHRDLKPANLRVTPDGWLKILDFGLAKQTGGGGDTTEPEVTESRTVVGTARYIAPELWLGQPASEASDVYAMGVILYEMACGVHPFGNVIVQGIAHAAVTHDPPTPRQRNPTLKRAFENVVLRCMRKDPAQRPASARDVGLELEALHARNLADKSGRKSRRAALIAAGLVLAAVVAVFVIRPWDPRPASHIRSLAVLPFVNLSNDPGMDYLRDGITDELISTLAETPNLRVISRTSAMHYKGTTMRLPQIALELGVDGIVQGSVQIGDDHVHISVQLIDGREDRQLWSKHYNGDMGDALEIQSRMARSIAHEIGLRLDDKPRHTSEVHVDPVAYQLYLQGRFQWNRRNPDGLRRAVEYFRSAIARDSLFAPAYCGLADAWANSEPATSYPEARQAALRALALDPGLSEGYVSLANIQQNFDWDWEGAARSYRRAIELNDNNAVAHHWYANHLALRGEFDRAMVEVRRAQDLDPLSLPINVGAGAFLYYARRYEGALVECRGGMQIDSSSANLNRAMAASYIQLGRPDSAAAAIQRWVEGSYPGPMPALTARAYQQAGLPGVLRLIVGAFEAQRNAGRYEPATHLAEVYCLLGERDRALHWLEVAYREHDIQLNRLKVDPIFDLLRREPRFIELTRKIGLAHAA